MHIVFFDIDGTLATGKDVPASAQKAVAELREKGDLVFICTGRNVNYVRRNFSHYADGYVTNNGRLAYLGDELIFDVPIEKETVKKLIRILKDIDMGYIFHTKDRGYYEGPEEGFSFIEDVGDPGYVLWGIDEEETYYNFDVFIRNREHLDLATSRLEGICIVNPHGPHPTADMTVIGTGKAEAIKAVAEKLNVDMDDVYAFGDGMNDISMMKAAGHGIAMGNGTDQTKAAAEYVTTDIDDDGVYNGLKHYGLI